MPKVRYSYSVEYQLRIIEIEECVDAPMGVHVQKYALFPTDLSTRKKPENTITVS